MTVKEFMDYVLTKMTAEQALLKMFEGGLIEYEKLKFDSQKKAVHPVHIIAMAAMDMGWQFMIEKDNNKVEGLTVGTEDYMKRLFPDKPPNEQGERK